MVSGAQISFNGICPVQHQSPPNSLPHAEADKIKDAIQELLDKQVIVPCDSDLIEFFSPIFTTPKTMKMQKLKIQKLKMQKLKMEKLKM
jgi:hypothetical protein